MKTTSAFFIGALSLVNAELGFENSTNPSMPKEPYGLDIDKFLFWMTIITLGICVCYEVVMIWPRFCLSQHTINNLNVENHSHSDNQRAITL